MNFLKLADKGQGNGGTYMFTVVIIFFSLVAGQLFSEIIAVNQLGFSLTDIPKNADLNFDMGNDGSTALSGVGAGGTTSSSSSVESGVANTVAITQSGTGDANGHSMVVDMKGGGSIVNNNQSGVEDKVINLTTVGNDAKIDIIQTD